MKRTLFLILIALCPLAAEAQTLVQKADSLLDLHYRRISYDTAYILRPERRWTLKLRPKLSWFNVRSNSTIEGADLTCDVSSSPKGRLSLSAGYSGISLSLSAKPEVLFNLKEQDIEARLDIYGRRMGFEMEINGINTLEGTLTVALENDTLRVPADRGYVSQFNIVLNGYYVFNHRHFSYPAAFTQSYIQRRSAGSLLAGIYIHGAQTTVGNADSDNEVYRIVNSLTAIGLGYGHNFVLPRRDGEQWLIHISAVPYFAIHSRGTLHELGKEREWKTRFPELVIVSRGAAIRSFGNWFAGFTMQYVWERTGNSSAVELFNARWHFMGILGVRL